MANAPHEIEAPDAPVSRETLNEISSLWDSIKEVSPGSGDMSASLQDFTNVKDDALVIEDATQSFDRLVSLNAKKQGLSDLWHNNDHPVVATSAALLGIAAFAYTIAQGPGSFPAGEETFGEAFNRDPITGSLFTAVGIGTVGLGVIDVLDRGYASFKGLGDALDRLNDGADPNADSLRERLSGSERDTYSDILRLGYEVSAGSDEVTQHRLLDQIRKTTVTITDKLQGTPQAGMIQEVLDNLHDSLASGLPSSEPDAEPRNAPMDNKFSPATTPGF